jgi:HD-like signal output (HDOD) protein
VSLQTWPNELRQAAELSRTGGMDFCQAERDVIGVDHQQLGAALAELWKFPRSCQLVAGHHHHPTTLSDNHRMLVTLVFVADTVCCQANCGFNLTAVNQRLEDGRLAELNMDLSLIERCRQELPAMVREAGTLF